MMDGSAEALDPEGRPIGAEPELLRQLQLERQARLEAEQLLAARTRELAEARDQARRLTEMDQLTGLPNRGCFAGQLEILIRDASAFALFLLDLDHFKHLNEALGHEGGDAVLRHVATSLFAGIGEADIVARLGGDEFAVLVRVGPGAAAPDQVAATIQRAVRAPFVFRDRTIEASCSTGIARFPEDASAPSELLRHADLALQRAKATRGTSVRYEPAMGHDYAARQALAAELAQAIDGDQIEAWFQPVYDHPSGQIVSAEALARWRHPSRGLLSPALFLDLAEERGLMHRLFASMLRSAAPVIRRWVGTRLLQSVAINVSPSQFMSATATEDIIARLREHDIEPSSLTIEITEEVLMQDFGRVSAQLDQLAGHGVRIALDDFGVGYSNISYLRQLSFQTLKVDRSLVADVATEAKVRSILGAIVVLARSLDLNLVAEGVETEAQATMLARLGYRRQQGYLHGRPMPAAEFDQVMAGATAPHP